MSKEDKPIHLLSNPQNLASLVVDKQLSPEVIKNLELYAQLKKIMDVVNTIPPEKRIHDGRVRSENFIKSKSKFPDPTIIRIKPGFWGAKQEQISKRIQNFELVVYTGIRSFFGTHADQYTIHIQEKENSFNVIMGRIFGTTDMDYSHDLTIEVSSEGKLSVTVLKSDNESKESYLGASEALTTYLHQIIPTLLEGYIAYVTRGKIKSLFGTGNPSQIEKGLQMIEDLHQDSLFISEAQALFDEK